VFTDTGEPVQSATSESISGLYFLGLRRMLQSSRRFSRRQGWAPMPNISRSRRGGAMLGEGPSMTIQRVPVTGGCLCGAVRYESKDPPTGGRVLPLQDLPEKRRRPFQRIRERSRIGFQVHEGRASLLSRQQFRQTGILRRVRFADSLLLRRESARLDQDRITRPSRGLAHDEGRSLGALHTRAYRHQDPVV